MFVAATPAEMSETAGEQVSAKEAATASEPSLLDHFIGLFDL